MTRTLVKIVKNENVRENGVALYDVKDIKGNQLSTAVPFSYIVEKYGRENIREEKTQE